MELRRYNGERRRALRQFRFADKRLRQRRCVQRWGATRCAANRTGFLRSRHDQVLDRLFAWSQESSVNRLQFTKLFALLRPAAIDLGTIYVQHQGLSPNDAEQATAIAMMELLWQATNYMAPGLGSGPVDAAAYSNYHPRYAILPEPQS